MKMVAMEVGKLILELGQEELVRRELALEYTC